MTFTLKRQNGEVVILSEKELNDVYLAAQVVWNKDYIIDMLNWKDFDIDSITDEQIEEITHAFLTRLCNRDAIGEIEADVFDETMKMEFPEIKKYDDYEEEK